MCLIAPYGGMSVGRSEDCSWKFRVRFSTERFFFCFFCCVLLSFQVVGRGPSCLSAVPLALSIRPSVCLSCFIIEVMVSCIWVGKKAR